MNGIEWNIYTVNPNNILLIDRTGKLTLATTDTTKREVYLSSILNGYPKCKVLIHELVHCALYSYGLLDQLHLFVDRSKWFYAEEWLCNFVADYANYIFEIAYDILGYDSIYLMPYKIGEFCSM